MQIKVAQRFKPFSHFPGAKACLPWSSVEVQAFPTKIILDDQVLDLALTGPIQNFTLVQDLERGEVRVFGQAKEGYYEFLIRAGEWILVRSPKEGLSINGKLFQRGDRQEIAGSTLSKKSLERLALGSHKSQEFSAIAKRCDQAEFLPFLFFLGQQLPQVKGSLPKLPFEQIFQAGFSDLFYPDISKEGLGIEIEVENPRSLLTEGARAIRERFFTREGDQLTFLADNSFPAGRFIDIHEEGLGTIHFEWTKHKMRRMIFESECEGEIKLHFPKSLVSCRLRNSVKEKGKIFQFKPLFVQKGQKIYLDQFQK